MKLAGSTPRKAAILSIAVLVLAMTLPGCGGGAKIGERATNKNVALTVHSAKFYDAMTTEVGVVVEPNNKQIAFAVVDLTVENLKDTTLTVAEKDFELTVSGNKEPVAPAILPLSPSILNRLHTKTLKKGEKAQGTVTYRVPKGQTVNQFEYTVKPEIKVDMGKAKVGVPPAPPLPKIGQPASANGMQIKVNTLTYPASLQSGSITTTAKPGGKLVLANMTFTNESKQPKNTVNSLDVRLIDEKGEGYMPNTVFTPGSIALTDLTPGQSVTGNIAWVIPAASTVTKVRYNYEVMGPPLEVSATP